MNSKLVYLLLSLGFLRTLVSMPLEVLASQSELNTRLIRAAEEGSVDLLCTLLRGGADVNACNSSRRSALHFAAREGHVDCLKALLEANADINARINCGQTALYIAVEYGHYDCFEALLDAKAEVNIRDKDGLTALHKAADRGDLRMVNALIKAKADVTILCDLKEAPLSYATAQQRISCVESLVKQSYVFVPLPELVASSRRRIFNALLLFVWLRKQYPQLDNLKAESLQHEILSWDKGSQEDLVIILLDELKRGREIKGVALIRSKEAAVTYLLKQLGNYFSGIPTSSFPFRTAVGEALMDPKKVKENYEDFVKKGLDERLKELKT